MEQYNFTSEEISDLIIGALEGGINYWCGKVILVKDRFDKIFKGVKPEDQEKVQYASDLIGLGGELILVGIDEPEERWVLTKEEVLEGIKMYCEENDITEEELMDNYDADSCDQIIQYGLFGEIVFG
jgi:hypothetical protein